MGLVIRNFRVWWQRPRDLKDRIEHRQVTFLELFYDLTYVVIVAELTHSLATHVDFQHLLNFIFLFFIVFWAWINGTLYHDVHGNDDIRSRIFTFLQMFTVAGMAIFAHDAFGETAQGFALSFAAFQLILTYLWWRTGVYDPAHRPLSTPYVAGFLVSTVLFGASVFVEPPMRFYFWFVATAISISLPFLNFTLWARMPEAREQMQMASRATASLVERFGLFTIIVLGEVIVAVVQGVAGHETMDMSVILIGATGMMVAVALWWLYFDFVSHRLPHENRQSLLVWMYAHIPVAGGIAVTGASVLNVIEHAGEQIPVEVRWLMVGAIALTLAGIALMIQTLDLEEGHRRTHRIGQIVMLLSALLIAGAGFSTLETIPLLVVMVLLLLAPVISAFFSWLADEETSRAQEEGAVNR